MRKKNFIIESSGLLIRANGGLKYLAQSESSPEFVRRKRALVTGMEMKARRNRKIITHLQDSSAIRGIFHIT